MLDNLFFGFKMQEFLGKEYSQMILENVLPTLKLDELCYNQLGYQSCYKQISFSLVLFDNIYFFDSIPRCTVDY